MGKGTYLYVFILLIGGIFVTVMCLIPIKGVIPIKADLPEKQYKKVRRTLNGILWLMKILKLGCLIIAIWSVLIPFALDLPYMIKQNYPVVSGTVISKYKDNTGGITIDVKSKRTGKIIEILLIGGGAEESDEVEIIYFPHFKVGNLVR